MIFHIIYDIVHSIFRENVEVQIEIYDIVLQQNNCLIDIIKFFNT